MGKFCQHKEWDLKDFMSPGIMESLANTLQMRFPKPNAAGRVDGQVLSLYWRLVLRVTDDALGTGTHIKSLSNH